MGLLYSLTLWLKVYFYVWPFDPMVLVTDLAMVAWWSL
jgi:hypothetical protein